MKKADTSVGSRTVGREMEASGERKDFCRKNLR